MNRKNLTLKHISRTVICLTAAGMLLAATGCSDKTVDYSIDEAGQETDAGSLVNVPSSYSGNLQTGDSGLSRISLSDDNITYPGTSHMVKSYYTRHVYSSVEVQALAEYLFDNPSEIYVYDAENPDSQKDLAADDGYESDTFTGRIDGVDFILYIGNYECYLTMEDDERLSYRSSINAADYSYCYFSPDSYYSWYADDTDGSTSVSRSSGSSNSTSNSSADSSDSSDSSSSAGADSSTADSPTSDNSDSGTNVCSYTEKEALDIAQDFLETVGLSDIQLVNTANLIWTYCDEDDNEVASDTDGYAFTFVRVIDNYPVTTVDEIMNDAIPGAGLPPAVFKVYVSSRGIVGAMWSALLEPTGKTETASLMTFDEIMEAANTSVCGYYTTYSDIIFGGVTINFNDITLSYFLTTGDSDDEFVYTPAWILSEYDQSSRAPGEDWPNHLVAIDATDGSAIDIPVMAEKLASLVVTQLAK